MLQAQSNSVSETAAPSHVPQSRIFPIDIYDDEKLNPDPLAGWIALRDQVPDVFFTPKNGGHWVVTRRDDILTILRNPQDYTSQYLDIPAVETPSKMAPLSMDPPDHTPYRHLLMRYFSLPRVRKHEQHIRQVANKLIDDFIEAGECEFVDQMASILPVSVFMELMGLPLERLRTFRDLADQVFSATDTDVRLAVYTKILAFMNEVIAARVIEPQDDLISEMIRSEVDGKPLGAEGTSMLVVLLFLGGMDTVTNAMTFAMRHLAQDANLQERIHQNPAMIPNLIEEFLRRYSFSSSVRRVVNDTTLGGATMRTGDTIYLSFTLGGVDDRAFADPLTVDPDRSDAAMHVTFGGGAHKCAGRHLGRLELKITLEEVARRLKNIRLKPGTRPKIRAGSVLAMETLALEFDAR